MTCLNFSLNITSLCLAATLLFSGCQKEEPEVVDPGNNSPVNTAPPFFRWQLDQAAIVTADSAYAYVQSLVIFAIKNTGANIEVNLASMNTGTYQISSATGNQLKYLDGSNEYEASGTFVISSSPSDKMSGHFSCTFPGGPPAAITGTFSEIPKRYN